MESSGWTVGDDEFVPDPEIILDDVPVDAVGIPIGDEPLTPSEQTEFVPDEDQSEADPFAGFPRQIQEDIRGLEFLGYLEDEFEFCGHRFVIRTTHGAEDLAAAVAAQPYRGTLKEPEAWMWAQVGISLRAVDGDFDFCPPIGPDLDDFAKARFHYVTKWFVPLGEYLFRRLLALRERQVAAFEALQSKSPRNRLPYSPTFGS